VNGECTLCGLDTPAEPVTAADVEGTFCCRGCLDVWRVVGDEAPTPGEIRERAGAPGEEGSDVLRSEADHSRDDGLSEAFLEIDGMHCTTCEAFLSLRGEARDGIESVEASYATDTVRVRYDPGQVDEADLPATLSGAGYRARFREGPATDRQPGDRDTFHRLVVGVVFAMLVMPWYVFFLYPSYVGIETGILTADMTTPVGLYLPMAIVGLLSGVVVFYAGWPILRGAYVSLSAREPNMDLLLSVAILSAYAYSTVALVTGSLHLYYDVAIAIVLVVTAGTYYEDKVKREATGLLSELTSMRVSEATRRRDDGTTETVDVSDLDPGDEVVVRPGERVPVDGTVLEGVAAVDEAVLTGESLPDTKRPGDEAVGGSVVTDSALVLRVGDDAGSTLDRLTSLVWAVQSERSGVQRFADRLAVVFVPLVLLIGVGVAAWRLAAGGPASAALLAGLTVLVAACPCAMGLATPLAIAGGLRDALASGIVVTDSSLFERAPAVDTVVFDKTGTLTTGEMAVRETAGDPEALLAAATVERQSSHPVAAAIVDHVRTATGGDGTRAADGGTTRSTESTDGGPFDALDRERIEQLQSATVTAFERHPGEGVSARLGGDPVVVGTPDLVERRAGPLSEHLRDAVREARESGRLPAVVGWDGEAAAVAVVGDREREDWAAVLASFEAEEVVVLTGDDEAATASFSEHPAVDRVFAGIPPDGKVSTVRSLKTSGRTAMVGDGTNDAPALGVADVGIAVAGTARAADAADAVLVEGSLSDVPAVFDLASATRRRIRENVAWALCYNGVAIPLAAAGVLNPLLAAVAMAASSLLVVTNSRRPLL